MRAMSCGFAVTSGTVTRPRACSRPRAIRWKPRCGPLCALWNSASPLVDSAAPPAYKVVAMLSSAGGLKALATVLSSLAPGFPVPIVVVQHLAPQRRSLLAAILGRYTYLEVKQAEDKETLRSGCV